jgi:dTDP-4-amino-4,6-dideoxygalactose transaminase
MDALAALCAGANLTLVEDADQGSGARWRDRALGGIGDIGTYSFHGTKNVGCGEEGARIVNRPELVARAEMIWEKGTDRLRQRRGETPHHEWCERARLRRRASLTSRGGSLSPPRASRHAVDAMLT